MTEQEYIVATNRVRITTALNLISQLTSGEGYGVTPGQKTVLLKTMHTMEDRMFKQIQEFIDEGEGE